MKKTVIMMVAAFAACGARAQVWDANDGASLEAALSAAGSAGGGVVRLVGGSYISPSAATFTVPANVSVVGGYATGFGSRNVELYPSILDGNQQAINVVTIGGADVTLDGIVITGARGASVRGIVKGTAGTLTMTECVISNNWMWGTYVNGVGAIFTAGDVVMDRCVVENNGRPAVNAANAPVDSYHGYGNGMYVQDANLTVTGCRFSGNDCDQGGSRGTMGGAIAFQSGTLRVSDTVFEENRCASNTGGGGAVWLGINSTSASRLVDASFSNCLFRANGFGVNGGTSWGGAVAVYSVTAGSAVTFSQCVFVDNYAGNALGGALYANSGLVTLRNTIFWNNETTVAGFNGTEIYVDGTGTLDADYLCLTSVKMPTAIRLPIGQSLGAHVMTNDPCFVSAAYPYDYHLVSQAGRWNGSGWFNDLVTSPCVDAGDPAIDGGIELGIYGGTAEASKSLVSAPPLVDVLLPVNVDTYTRYSLGGVLTNPVPFNAATVVFVCYGTDEIAEETFEGWDEVVVVYPPAQGGVPFAIVTPFLEKGTEYFVRVYAANALGESWSGIERFTPLNNPPVGYGIGGGEDVVHVRLGATDGEGDGRDWFNAFTSLEAAVEALGGTRTNLWISGDEYAMLPGIVTMPVDVVMLGGFTGVEFSPGERPMAGDVALFPTVIRGGGCRIVIDSAQGAMDNVIFTGFTEGPAIERKGGGAFAFTHCVFTNNIYENSRNLGILYLNGGNVTVDRCIVSDNATRHWDTRGMGISTSASTSLSVFDSDFSRNHGDDLYASRQSRGGALLFNGPSLLMERCRFSGNEMAAHDDNGGGAIAFGASTGNAVVRNCLFDDNRLLLVGNCNGYSQGAAIFADLGGAGNVLIENCTFTGNRSEGNLASDGAVSQRGGTLTLRNNIFWGNVWTVNAVVQDADLNAASGATVLGYNSFTDASALRLANGAVVPATMLYGDPLFADPVSDDYHLQSPFGRWEAGAFVYNANEPLSPCIDAGDPSDPVGEEVAPNGGRINLGCYGGTAEASKSLDLSAIAVTLMGHSVSDHTQMALWANTVNAVSNGVCTVGFAYGLVAGASDSTNGWDHVTLLPAAWPIGEPFSALTRYLEPNQEYSYMAFVMAGTVTCSSIDTFTTQSQYPEGWGVGGGANVVHVRKEAYGNNDGSDWFNAYVALEDGLAALDSVRETLWIGEGTYYPAAAITLTDAQRVVGGFAGTETAESQRVATTPYTILNGNALFRPVFVQEGNVLMDTIIVTNVPLPAGSPYKAVAAVTKTGAGTLSMVNCKVTGIASASGDDKQGVGCHFAAGGAVIMERCEVSECTTVAHSTQGAGIYSACDLTLIDCLIARNHGFEGGNNYQATRHSAGFGLHAAGGTLTMLRTEILDNYGAGVSDYSFTTGGAGVHIANGMTNNVLIQNCLFRGNRSYAANLATSIGGAGAGLMANFNRDDVTLDIVNCTFTGNRTDAYDGRGGGLFVTRGQVNIKNSILWDNLVTGNPELANGHDLFVANTTLNLSYACIDTEGADMGYDKAVIAANVTATLGEGLFAADPLFVSESDSHLQSKAGYWDRATQTWLKSPANSPCISAGDKASDHSLEPLPSGSRINLGAYGNTPEASKAQPLNTLILIR
ncbi:MAG: right-handed parallel beta-helix repeat-containing protein [Kiritimatiellaeota bacterium]|nr:right-handed parallel beta-helix repeat-containing protein [Kiritimatiellota bacterium]